MSKKCLAYSKSKLGLEPADNRKAFYAGWDAAIEYVCGGDMSQEHVDETAKRVRVSGVPYPVQLDMDLSDGGDHD